MLDKVISQIVLQLLLYGLTIGTIFTLLYLAWNFFIVQAINSAIGSAGQAITEAIGSFDEWSVDFLNNITGLERVQGKVWSPELMRMVDAEDASVIKDTLLELQLDKEPINVFWGNVENDGIAVEDIVNRLPDNIRNKYINSFEGDLCICEGFQPNQQINNAFSEINDGIHEGIDKYKEVARLDDPDVEEQININEQADEEPGFIEEDITGDQPDIDNNGEFLSASELDDDLMELSDDEFISDNDFEDANDDDFNDLDEGFFDADENLGTLSTEEMNAYVSDTAINIHDRLLASGNELTDAEIREIVKVNMDSMIDQIAIDYEITTEEVVSTVLSDFVDTAGTVLKVVGTTLSWLNFLLIIIGLIITAYNVGKRLWTSYHNGGILLPIQPPIWIFDFTDLHDKPVNKLSDVKFVFDKHQFKKNPSGYIGTKLKSFLSSGGFEPNKNYKIEKTSEWVAFKRDPRIDGFDWKVQALHNTYDGWVFWTHRFDTPITNHQVDQAYWNICYAMALEGGMSKPLLDTKTIKSDYIVGEGNSDETRRAKSVPYVNGFNANEADHLGVGGTIEKYTSKVLPTGTDAIKYQRIQWNSGVNITLVGMTQALYRMLLGFKLRSTDLWYLLPPFWVKNGNLYELMTEFESVYGQQKIRLVDDLPVDAINPHHYWEMGPDDIIVKDNLKIPDKPTPQKGDVPNITIPLPAGNQEPIRNDDYQPPTESRPHYTSPGIFRDNQNLNPIKAKAQHEYNTYDDHVFVNL